MIKLFLLLFSISIVNFICAQDKNEIRIRIVEVHGEYFGNLKVNKNDTKVSVNQPSAGISINLGKKFISSVIGYNYRVFDLKPISGPKVKYHELMFGLRYFSMIPTFMSGKMAVRITAGAVCGFDMEPNFRYMFFGGLFFSPIRSVNGVSLNVVYRPETLTASGFTFTPSWALRLGIILGPSFD